MSYTARFTRPGLELAWRRIATGRNQQYKRFFRPLYQAFEPAHPENISLLWQRLLGAWAPTKPRRILVPKPSGLQRPLTILSLEDQIVLQAVADIFASRLAQRRVRVQNEVVFSNLLNTTGDPIFFLEDWRTTYARFLMRAQAHFKAGRAWVADFDFAAFYDTISHEQLIRMGAPRGGQPEFWNRIRICLRCWTSAEGTPPVEHGIPQGPIASDFLAECFLLPLDEALLGAEIPYIRYVDDILLFAESQVEAQKAAVFLEECVRGLGLIPHGSKFGIRNVSSFEEVRNRLPSLADPLRIGRSSGSGIPDQKRLDRVFLSGIGGRPLRILDKSRVRYALFRSGKSEAILKRVLLLLRRQPEEIDAFSVFLSNYEKSERIERLAGEVLVEGTPYDYVRGELWQLLARICRSTTRRRELLEEARRDLRGRRTVGLRWGVLAFMLHCQKQGLCRCVGHVSKQDPLVKALLVPHLPESEFSPTGIVPRLLRDRCFEPGMVLAEAIILRHQSLGELGVSQSDLPHQVQNTFAAVGLLQAANRHDSDDIAAVLARLLNVPGKVVWRSLLGPEYSYALSILLEAKATYDSNRSHWLQLQDSFNDALTRALLGFLKQKGHAAGRSDRDRNGNLIDFGVLLESKQSFFKALPSEATTLQLVHTRRNQIPGSHPYQKKGGTRSRYLKPHEQAYFSRELRKTYEAIQDLVLSLGI